MEAYYEADISRSGVWRYLTETPRGIPQILQGIADLRKVATHLPALLQARENRQQAVRQAVCEARNYLAEIGEILNQ